MIGDHVLFILLSSKVRWIIKIKIGDAQTRFLINNFDEEFFQKKILLKRQW